MGWGLVSQLSETTKSHIYYRMVTYITKQLHSARRGRFLLFTQKSSVHAGLRVQKANGEQYEQYFSYCFYRAIIELLFFLIYNPYFIVLLFTYIKKHRYIKGLRGEQ